jgi:hypothetical protein
VLPRLTEAADAAAILDPPSRGRWKKAPEISLERFVSLLGEVSGFAEIDYQRR